MIHRLYIDGYKSLREVELKLHPLAAIFGPNAFGKSNLFDALGLLARIVSSPSLADAFKGHRGDPLEAFSLAEGGMSGLLEKDEARFSIEVDLELSENTQENLEENGASGRFLRYRIVVALLPKSGTLRVADEELRILQEKNGLLSPDPKRRPLLERIGDRFYLKGRGKSLEYKAGLDHAIASQPLYPPHYPYLNALREELSRWQFYTLQPQRMRGESPLRETYWLSPSGEGLAALYHTLKERDPQGFRSLQETLRVFLPSLEEVNTRLTPDGKVLLRIKEHGVEFSDGVLSDGTLRLLGLGVLLSRTNPATLIAIEEPENGVYPDRLEFLAGLLLEASQKRQVILNTYSPELLRHLPESCLVKGYREKDGRSLLLPCV